MPVFVPEISKGNGFSLFFRVIFVIASLLLLVSLGKSLFTGSIQNLSFSSLLEYISTIDFTTINLKITDFIIYTDWGVFNFLRDFINFFTGSLGVLAFLGSNLFNVLVFLVRILSFVVA